MMRHPQQAEGSVAAQPASQDLARPRPTILVVEDSDDDFFLLQRAFRKLNPCPEIVHLREGAETIRYLTAAGQERLSPALLLLDLKLPGVSGFDLLKWIRNDPVFKLLRINVLSSSAEASDIQKAFELGANAYTVKPMGLDQYDHLVAALLKFWLELCELPSRSQPEP